MIPGVDNAALDELQACGYTPSTFDEALRDAMLMLGAHENTARLFLTDDASDRVVTGPSDL